MFSRIESDRILIAVQGNAGAFIKKAKTPEEVVLSDYLTKLITSTHEHLFLPYGYHPRFAMAIKPSSLLLVPAYGVALPHRRRLLKVRGCPARRNS